MAEAMNADGFDAEMVVHLVKLIDNTAGFYGESRKAAAERIRRQLVGDDCTPET